MAHNVETMAYAGETPWHGLGVKVSSDLTPAQILEKAGLNWRVAKVQAFIKAKSGEEVKIDSAALVRSNDRRILGVVPASWQVVQNDQALAFFDAFIQAGHMEMHTAGSLRSGECIWALAKVKDGISLFNGDDTEAYLLLSSFHKYGFCTDIRFTPVRVVCNNTLSLALNSAAKNQIKVSHRVKFNPEAVRETLGIAHKHLLAYKEQAQFIGSRRAKGEDVVNYFKRLFPATGEVAAREDLSRNARRAVELLETQPGAEFAKGSWWQAYNAVTYLTDHELGRSPDTRLWSAWYGPNQRKKLQALNLAILAANDSRQLLPA
jgi:phage/plasmid-like protein (TIGR03299 family)